MTENNMIKYVYSMAEDSEHGDIWSDKIISSDGTSMVAVIQFAVIPCKACTSKLECYEDQDNLPEVKTIVSNSEYPVVSGRTSNLDIG